MPSDKEPGRRLAHLSRAQRELVLRQAANITWRGCDLNPCYGVPFPEHPTDEQLDVLEGSLSWILEHELGL